MKEAKPKPPHRGEMSTTLRAYPYMLGFGRLGVRRNGPLSKFQKPRPFQNQSQLRKVGSWKSFVERSGKLFQLPTFQPSK